MTAARPVETGAIRVEHLWKRFNADRSRPVLRDKIGVISDALHRRQNPARWRWALRDVDLSIAPGEAVGLFGSNGSGKSTLLKILTRVMYPTFGNLTIRGRVGALIEIRAGIHPDLTGRENIYLYGSIMGLGRADIARRFDAMVEFADLSDALDRQLKYYSSGMAMRLGFAVAAFLQPDVLLVDEVLAVGDATFQQKCLDRMRAVLQEGTTLVFVSHDLAAIESISRRGVWLRDGHVATDGPIRESMSAYRQHIESVAAAVRSSASGFASTVSVAGPDGLAPMSGEELAITVRIDAPERCHAGLYLGISEGSAAPVFAVHQEVELEAGPNGQRCRIPGLPLPRGRYFAWVALTDPAGKDLIPWYPATSFDVQGPDLDPVLPGVTRLSPVHVGATWQQTDPGPTPSRAETAKS